MGVRRDAIARIVGITAEYFGRGPTATVLSESPELPPISDIVCVSTHLDGSFWDGIGASYSPGVGWTDGANTGDSLGYELDAIGKPWVSNYRPLQAIVTIENPDETPTEEFTPFVATVAVRDLARSRIGEVDVLFTEAGQSTSIAIDLDFTADIDIRDIVVGTGFYQKAPIISCIAFVEDAGDVQGPSGSYDAQPVGNELDFTSSDGSMTWNGTNNRWENTTPGENAWRLDAAGGWNVGARPDVVTVYMFTDATTQGSEFTLQLQGPAGQIIATQTRHSRYWTGGNDQLPFTLTPDFSAGVDISRVVVTSPTAQPLVVFGSLVMREEAPQ